MALVTINEVTQWLGIEGGSYFEVNGQADLLIFTSDQGTATIQLTDGSYDGDEMAAHLETQMNANDTLTGTGTITFSVSWSSTTRKFTVDAGSGHTIALTLLGSSAAGLLGWFSDQAAAQTITSDLEIGDPTFILDFIREIAEAYAKWKCNRSLELADYIEYSNGNGGSEYLWTTESPLVSIERVSIGQEYAILIENTLTDHVYGNIVIDEDGISLKIVGGASAGTSSVSFETYTTLSAIVAAINALGSGWTATIYNDDFSLYPYTELIRDIGIRIPRNDYKYLMMPDQDDVEYEIIDQNNGCLYRRGGWPRGVNSVRLEYSAGYATIPDQLKAVIFKLIQFMHARVRDGSLGLKSIDIGSESFEKENVPEDVMEELILFRRRAI